MSLRIRVILLFVAFAIVPLLAIGAFDYVRSMGALEALAQNQTGVLARHIADEVADRFETVQANLALVADNEDTKSLLRGVTGGPSASHDYFNQVWSAIGSDFEWIAIDDSSGNEQYRFGAGGVSPSTYTVTLPIAAPGRSLGVARGAVRLASLVSADFAGSSFGRTGYSLILDSETGKVLYGAGHPTIAPVILGGHDSAQSLRFSENDSARIGTVIRMQSPRWTVLSAATLDEFTSPFASIRATNLFLVLVTTGIAALAFLLMLWRATHSLQLITAAADEVGRGNFHPSLPPASGDEVGRLGSAFGIMTAKLGDMVSEIERSRQMVVVGEFASQIAHEIRNPLTSIKLNLQKLQRFGRAGRLPAETDQPIEITLREIDRLDRVVHGVLRLGGSRLVSRARVDVGALVERVADTARPQLDAKAISLEVRRSAHCSVAGDAALIESALLNLVLNASEASPPRSIVHVDVEGDEQRVLIVVRDAGPGIPREHRERIFQPFFTTKESGTGLGLAVAQRVVEQHGGTLVLDDDSTRSGAAFIMELPIEPLEPPAEREE